MAEIYSNAIRYRIHSTVHYCAENFMAETVQHSTLQQIVMAHKVQYLTTKPKLMTRTVECLSAVQHLVAHNAQNVSLQKRLMFCLRNVLLLQDANDSL